ncbi:MAG TPA: asparagine synthase (glutamine-hydrolyzing) [Sedimentisphaerales bacterium]|nr:asparagine synthase (glutamine-hydrolyzing) [Sedimentisphaerales bacterium]
MCGIVGFNWEDEKKIKLLACLLEHRGPEQEGYHIGDGVSIGHKRLRILDLSEKARQPLYNEDETICISYNGEIFNFESLRQTLEQAGHQFVSRTDTEVLVHGYEQWGIDLLKRVNGQFAFCIFDKKKNIFFLARDHVGIKPLYYYQKDGSFIFGSELKVFLKSDIEKRISRKALDYYLLFGNTPSRQSILENVEKLLPGSYIIYDLTSLKIKEYVRYWTLSFSEDPSMSTSEVMREILQRLDRSVRMQLISDVPLGAFLSGGVDSSIIVALMRKYVKDLNTFSIKFDRPGYNESKYAAIVSDKFQTQHHEIEFNAESVRNLISELPYYYDEPFADPSMIPTCLVSRVAKRYVTVSLSGTGGDELFGGYHRYIEFMILKRLNQLPAIPKKALSIAVRTLNVLLRNDKLNKLQTFMGGREEAWVLYFKLFSYMFRSRQEQTENMAEFEYLRKHFKYEDDTTNALNFDINEYLPDCLLTKEDRASMAVSLEVRVPFLDHTLIEFAATIPPRLKIKGTDKKHILKKAFSNVLPRKILYRRKRGFAVPLVHYLRNELRDLAYKEIFDSQEFDYYDKNSVKNLWQTHQKGHADYSRLFWSIMMFNMWYKRWMA